MRKERKRQLRQYIRKQRRSGYSYSSVYKAILTYGYDEDIAKSLVQREMQASAAKVIGIIGVLLIIIVFGLSNIINGPTGFVPQGKTKVYTETLNQSFTSSQIIDWKPVRRDIGWVKISGTYIGTKPMKIYFIANDTRLLLFEYPTNTTEGILITGFAVSNESNLSSNVSDVEIGANETSSNLTNAVDDLTKKGANESAPTTNETGKSDSIGKAEESIINDTTEHTEIQAGNETASNISIILKPAKSIATKKDAVTVDIDAAFSWNTSSETLCTRWEAYSYDTEISTFTCQGSEECCASMGLDSASEQWNDTYYAQYGRNGATERNTIAASVLYHKFDIENLTIQSAISNLVAVNITFVDAIIEFTDQCRETCAISLNQSEYKIEVELEEGKVMLNSIAYTSTENARPSCSIIPNISFLAGTKTELDLSQYCSDPDNDTLIYALPSIENITFSINGNLLSLSADSPTQQFAYLAVSDGIASFISNVFEINVLPENTSITTRKPSVVVGKPVKWTKIVNLSTETASFNIEIHPEATNITVRKIEDQEAKEIAKEKLKVRENATVKTLEDFEDERKEKAINSQKPENAITGNVVAEILAQENTTELIIEENITEAEVEYYTEGPAAEEFNISDTRKTITISSGIHYEDILAFTELPREVSNNQFSLYWLVNNSKIKIETTNYDTNNNSLIDYIEWIVPSLSNQTYELSLEILTLHSVAKLGENWTVYFNTTGIGNLTISLITNETYNTTWGEWPIDDNATRDHLRFIDLKARIGNVNNISNESDTNSTNESNEYASIDHEKGLDPITNKIIKITKQDWNYTEGVLINEWLVEAHHAIKFEFNDIIAYALNAPPTQSAPILNSTETSNITTQNLTCYNRSTAGDGTVNVTSIFTWYRNGVLNVSSGIINGTISDNGLVAWYPFDNDYYDYGLSYNGTRNGNTFINRSGGNRIGGGAAQFDGDVDYINVTNHTGLNIVTALTIEAWFYASKLENSKQSLSDSFTDPRRIANTTNVSVNFSTGRISLETVSSTSEQQVNFTANGTWTKPAGVVSVNITLVAGGGGGGGGGGVGSGDGGTGGTGGNTTFNGAVATSGTGGTGGKCGGGSPCFGQAGAAGSPNGGNGGAGSSNPPTCGSDGSSGTGGSSGGSGGAGGAGQCADPNDGGGGGGGGGGGYKTLTQGTDGTSNGATKGSGGIGYGAGGGGGAGTDTGNIGSGGGGGGGNGGVTTQSGMSVPDPSYTVVVGSGGTAGTAGGVAGGAGAGGFLQIIYNIQTVYKTEGNVTSVNLLAGQTVSSIDMFGYNVSSIPKNTNVSAQFSQDNQTWVNSSNDIGGWDNMTLGAGGISLSALNWYGSNFYYRIQLRSNSSNTPIMDSIHLNYTSSSKSIAEKQGSYGIKVNASSLIAIVNTGALQSASTPISQGRWYHAAATYDNSQLTLYLDGVSSGSQATSGSVQQSGYDFFIGSLDSQVNFFNGTIDDVKIYNRSLLSSEIYQHYISGLGNHTESLATMIYNFTAPGENWTCEVTPIDYLSLGSPANSTRFTVKFRPPSVTALNSNATENITRSANTVNFSAVVTTVEAGTLLVNLNGTSLTQSSNNIWWLTSTPSSLGCVAEGSCTLILNATIGDGENTSQTITLTIDNTAPVISEFKSNDTDNITRADRLLNLTVTATDTNIQNVSINGTYLIQAGNNWWSTNTTAGFGCPANDNCQLNATALDKAGNFKTAAYNFTVDNSTPTVSAIFTNKTNNVTRSDVNLTFNISASDHIKNISLNRTYLLIGNLYWYTINTTTQLGCPTSGVCSLAFNITDLVDQSNTSEGMNISIDDTFPTIHNFTSNKAPLNITGQNQNVNFTIRANDTGSQANITINGSVMTQNGDGTNISWLAATPSTLGCPSTGNCTLTAIIIDQAGNSNATNYTLTLIGQGPDPFALLEPKDGTVSGNQSPFLRWQASSSSVFANYSILVDDTGTFESIEFIYNTTGVNSTNATADDVWSTNKTWFWKVIAYDTEGFNRSSTQAFKYIIDRSAPVITGETNTSGETPIIYANTSVLANATVVDDNLNQAWISGNWTGEWQNITVTANNAGNYTFTIGSGNFSTGEVVGWRYYANDSAGNMTTGSLQSFNISNRNSPPAPSLAAPINNSIKAANNIIFGWNPSIDSDNDNVTYELEVGNDASFASFDLVVVNISQTMFSNIFTNASLSAGTKYWRVRAYDGFNYSAYSNVSVLDSKDSAINITSPLNDSVLQRGSAQTITVQNLRGADWISNVVIEINGTQYTASAANDWSVTLTIPDLRKTLVNITAIGYNSSNQDTTRAFIIARISNSSAAPRIEYVCSNESYIFNNSNATLVWKVTDSAPLNSTNITILTPASATLNLSVDRSEQSGLATTYYSSYFINETGNYTLTASVTDINANTAVLNGTVYSFAVGNGTKPINLTGIGITGFKLRDRCGASLLGTGSNHSVPIESINNIEGITSGPSIVVNRANASNITFLFNYTDMGTGIIPPSSTRSLLQFGLHTNFTNYQNFTITYNYSDAQSAIDAENSLAAYYCADTSSCVWAQLTSILDNTQKTISIEDNRTGYYLIGEPVTTITRTVVTGAPLSPAAPPKLETKVVSLKMEAVEPLALYISQETQNPIKITNIGQLAVNGISLSAASDDDDLKVNISPQYLSLLNIQEASLLNLSIASQPNAKFGRRAINITAAARKPDISESLVVYIDITDREGLNRSSLLRELEFAKDLFSQNPECNTLRYLIDEAEAQEQLGNLKQALALVEQAIEACRDRTGVQAALKSPPRFRARDVMIFIGELTALILLGMLMYGYYKARGEGGG